MLFLAVVLPLALLYILGVLVVAVTLARKYPPANETDYVAIGFFSLVWLVGTVAVVSYLVGRLGSWAAGLGRTDATARALCDVLLEKPEQ